MMVTHKKVRFLGLTFVGQHHYKEVLFFIAYMQETI